MGRPGALTVLAALLAALAGCAGDPQEPAPAGPDPAAAARIDAPRPWAVGDHWRMDGGGRHATFVVTQDLGDDWLMDTDDDQNAFFEARSDASFMGAVRKTDLAGSENSTRVEFFRFPLETGRSWTTQWDDQVRTITVVSVEEGVAELEARVGDVLRVRYTYEEEAGWFGRFEFHDVNGTLVFQNRLVTWGQGFQGTVIRYELQPVFKQSGALGATPTAWGDTFEVPDGITDLWASVSVRCPSGTFQFGIGPEATALGAGADAGPSWGVSAQCPHETTIAAPIVEAPQPGPWRYGLIAASPTGQGSYAFDMILRTRTDVAVGG